MLKASARRMTGIVAVLLALAGTLTGCTSDATTTPTPTVTTPKLPPVVDLPTDIPNDPETRANVQVSGCAATEDGWEAFGTVTNRGEEATTAVITVFFTTDEATVIGTAQTSVTLEPGDEQSWTARASFPAAEQTLCVLRGAGVAG